MAIHTAMLHSPVCHCSCTHDGLPSPVRSGWRRSSKERRREKIPWMAGQFNMLTSVEHHCDEPLCSALPCVLQRSRPAPDRSCSCRGRPRLAWPVTVCPSTMHSTKSCCCHATSWPHLSLSLSLSLWFGLDSTMTA